MLRLPIISFILLAGSFPPLCGSAEEGKPKPVQVDGYEDDSFKVFPDPSGKAYFPEGKASYYTRYLLAMKEPSVQADLPEGATFVLRFTLLQTFADNLVVRIYDRGGKIQARAVRQKKDNNYNPVRITDERTITLNRGLPEEVKKLIAKSEFWRTLNGDENGMAGLDGAQWIFELRDKTGYHLLDLWAPDAPRRSDEILKQAGFEPAQIRDYPKNVS